jgi:tetratricopeptide (TPR) repeat protein
LLAARIDRLSDEERRVLQAASVIGRSFRRAVLQRAIDDDIDLDKVLQALVRAELIEVEDQTAGSYRFRNSLAQDTVYRSILRRTRRGYHRRVGEALLLTGDQAAEHLPALAHHFYQAQDQRALPFNQRAGDQAHELFANKEAAIYYSRAIEMAQLFGTSSTEELAKLYMSRGRVLELASSFSEALDSYREMGEVAEKRQDKPMALAALVATGTIYSTANENYNAAEAESLAEKALALAQELGDEASEAKIQWNLMNTYRLSERPPLALSAGERSLELARKNDLREQLAYTANDMAHVYMSAGLPEKARSTVTEAIGLWRQLGNQQMLADSLSTATLLSSTKGEFEKAIALSEEAFQISLATKNLWGQSYSKMAVGFLYWQRGEPDKAIETMSECVRLGELAGFVVAPIYVGAGLALVYANLGDYGRAVSMAQGSLAESRANIPYYEPVALSTLGQIFLLAGRLQEAKAVFEEMMTIRSYLEPMLESSVEEGMSRFHFAQHEFKQAAKSARNLLGVVREIDSHVGKPTALQLYGRALLGDGQLEQAGSVLHQALSEAERMELLWSLWQIQATLADWAEARGEQEEATDYRQQARQNFETIAGRISDQKLRDSFVSRAGFQALA